MAATALSSPDRLQLAVAKSKERLRLNSIKILHFDSRDTIVINEAFRQVQSFISGLHLTYGLTTSDIMAALQAAHQAADEHFTMRHTEAWDTTFIIPQADIDADMKLFQDFNYDFTSLCKYKQSKLASNRISPARIRSIFGNTGTKVPGVDPRDIAILLDFAANGITPPVAPLRDRHIKLQHPINRLLYKQYTDGTMKMLLLQLAQQIPGIHFSPQHHADSKGKPEGRVIGDLTGQHDVLLMGRCTTKMTFARLFVNNGVISNTQQSTS